MLTTSEIERYREDGFVIPRNFRLSETELECLRDAVDSVISTNPDTPTNFLDACERLTATLDAMA